VTGTPEAPADSTVQPASVAPALERARPERPAHQALYRRWRAQTFSEIVGQGPVVETLRNAVRLDRVAHGLLFVGPRGTGKTSMARIVAKAINCSNPRDGEPCDICASCVSIRDGRALDVVEMDAASNNRVDDMRELLPRVYTAAADVRRKVFIVDEVQRIKEGWDVLLKTLEEPPDDVVFIFCTTNPAQIRPAVVSRLQRYTFRPLTVEEIAGKLKRILEEERRAAEPAAVQLVAELAAGGMRDAESMLDQLLAGAVDPLTADAVRDLLGLADEAAVNAFIDALAGGDVLTGVRTLDGLEENGRDLVAFADQVVARLRGQLVERLAAGPSASGSQTGAAALARVARRLTRLDATRAGAGGYRFQLELALFEASPEAVPGEQKEAVAPVRARASAGTALPEPQSPAIPPERAQPRPPPDKGPPTRARTRADPVTDSGAPVTDTAAPAPKTRATATPQSAAAASPSTATAKSADGAIDVLEQLRSGWPEVVAHVARNPANRPLIAACRPVEVQGHVVVLGFPEDQAFLRDIADRKRAALEEGVRAVLGATYSVRCVAANVEMLPPLATEETVDVVEQARRIFQDELADVAEIS
jgi:DNA polymerase III subunit gamma/tau